MTKNKDMNDWKIISAQEQLLYKMSRNIEMLGVLQNQMAEGSTVYEYEEVIYEIELNLSTVYKALYNIILK